MESLDRQEQQKRDEAMAEERKAFMDVMKAFYEQAIVMMEQQFSKTCMLFIVHVVFAVIFV